MSKLNTNTSLDPDFGNTVPPVDRAYWVSVFPEEKKNPPFRFVLLMPIITNFEEEESYIHAAIVQLIGDDATAKVRAFDEDTFEDLPKNTAVASFNPDDPEDYVWLTPPKSYFN